MNTGCQGPFNHGTGGWCGCNCKCCPPPCCPVISVYFDCGTDCLIGSHFLQPCVSQAATPMPLANWQIGNDAPRLPEFSDKLIYSKDGDFKLGTKMEPCSIPIPCETICVELRCGGITPCCCLELLNGHIYSVGNGFVTAPATVPIAKPGHDNEPCGVGHVYINGSPPPVFVYDGEEICVTVKSDDELCCECDQIGVRCSVCPPQFATKYPLFRRKIDPRSGKPTINPRTGRPIIVIDKNELRERIRRAKRLKRRS